MCDDHLCGIASLAAWYCDAAHPAIFVKVAAYRNWIDETLAAPTDAQDFWTSDEEDFHGHCVLIKVIFWTVVVQVIAYWAAVGVYCAQKRLASRYACKALPC